MYELVLVLFAITAGFTFSGIAANLYRLSGVKAKSSAGRTLRFAVMTIAGPSVIFENAVRGRMAKTWAPGLFGLALVGVAYWSLGLGLFVLEIGLALSASA
jgi:hypothetical protein